MRRFALCLMLTAALVCALPGSAAAWCNGPAVKGHAGDGYGTHDWLLQRAIKNAGAGGTWVVRKTALLASDNPDSRHVSAIYHNFQESGKVRGAPQMVSDMYHKVIAAYQAGDMASASTFLGELSHYYSDITEPFHTTGAAPHYRTLHIRYEYSADDYENTPSRSLSWITLRPTQPVTDIRAKTVAAAEYARSYFPALLKAFKKSPTARKGTVNRITRLVQSRAVNDLADIIASVPSAAGEATAVADVALSLTTSTPWRNQAVGAYVSCTDPSGRPVEAVGVTYTWSLPTGTTAWTSFTEKDGRVFCSRSIGALSVGQSAPVTVCVTVNGVTTTVASRYTAIR
jgi:hypothetical protein